MAAAVTAHNYTGGGSHPNRASFGNLSAVDSLDDGLLHLLLLVRCEAQLLGLLIDILCCRLCRFLPPQAPSLFSVDAAISSMQIRKRERGAG